MASDNDDKGVCSFIKLCPSLLNSKAYLIPTPFLCTGILQTVYCSSLALKHDDLSNIKYDRELREMSDKGTVSIDWYPESSNNDAESTQPIAIVIPGLGGSSYEYHIRSLAKYLIENSHSKLRVAAINHRGSGRTPLTSSKLYNAYDTSDLHELVQYISERFPKAKLVCVGFSLGANIMTRYMGELADNNPLTAAVAISCPFDTEVSGRALSAPGFFNDRLFQPNLMAAIKRVVSRNREIIQQSNPDFDIDAILKVGKLCDFDNLVTSRVYGHEDCWSYYKAASSTDFVDKITRPFLAINALDDPVTPFEGVPVDKFRSNPNTALVIVKHGGHIGFFTGVSPRAWFLSPVTEFLDAVLANDASK
ncbi:AB-hydrolase YheT [Coemansia reversa NRRL 1564]|uniref:AB-hydrolase YheT n=1 Tax=Coemansia reversa (strain ATCC 12441 / NRRL 1564) TaxID=763665 RepID=A0A2G5BGS2_COERN|nr:AB-hydrolase YheT [Coemansia reversa NRRL 1564]|eukprot:PIA18238.1 AB-hydrolase YheT [Coemansia reversa NRRL 1564]